MQGAFRKKNSYESACKVRSAKKKYKSACKVRSVKKNSYESACKVRSVKKFSYESACKVRSVKKNHMNLHARCVPKKKFSYKSACKVRLRFLAQCMHRTFASSLLVATSSFWDMAFPRVSRLVLQLLGQLLEAASTEHQCALILLRTMSCLGRLVVMLFPAVTCEPENCNYFGPVFWPRFCGR